MPSEILKSKNTPRRFKDCAVSSQHQAASEVGASVLANGGNAIDATIAAAFAIGVVEPWQSGLGGVGKMVVSLAQDEAYSIIEFPAKSPLAVSPDDYRILENQTSGMFKWPRVDGDRNSEGPYSVCVPGLVKGLGLAHKLFAKLSWSDLVDPAVDLSKKPTFIDPITILKFLTITKGIERYPILRDVFFPDNLPPVTDWLGQQAPARNEKLTNTLQMISRNGPDDFYAGELADLLSKDLQKAGVQISVEDLRQYEAFVTKAEPVRYEGGLSVCLSDTEHSLRSIKPLFDRVLPTETGSTGLAPNSVPGIYRHMHSSFLEKPASPTKTESCTTHISCVDAEGNAVSLTTTLLSLFGSKVMLSESGVILNNGMMWFNPRQGYPNSIAASTIPQNNMCPIIFSHGNEVIATGASGGRRILPCVAQIVLAKALLGIKSEDLVTYPRMDVSIDGDLIYDKSASYGFDVVERFSDIDLLGVEDSVYPNYFGCPNLVSRNLSSGACVASSFPYLAGPAVSGA